MDRPMDRGAGWVTVHSVAKSWTQMKRFSMHTCNDKVLTLAKLIHDQLGNEGGGKVGREEGREKAMAPHSSTLAWKIPYRWRSLVGYSPWGR